MIVQPRHYLFIKGEGTTLWPIGVPDVWVQESLAMILSTTLPSDLNAWNSRKLITKLALDIYKALLTRPDANPTDSDPIISSNIGEILQTIVASFPDYSQSLIKKLQESAWAPGWWNANIQEQTITWLITGNHSIQWRYFTVSEHFAYELLKLYGWKIRDWLAVREFHKADPWRYAEALKWEDLLSDFAKFSYAIDCLWVYMRSKWFWVFPVYYMKTKVSDSLKKSLTELANNYEILKNKTIHWKSYLTIIWFSDELEVLYRAFQDIISIIQEHGMTPEKWGEV